MISLFNALPGALSQGLIWGIMAIGLYITYKILEVSDLTVDGSFCTGGAVCIVMMAMGYPTWLAMVCAFLAGMLTGAITGFLHTACKIPAILAGILTQLAREPCQVGNQAALSGSFRVPRGCRSRAGCAETGHCAYSNVGVRSCYESVCL